MSDVALSVSKYFQMGRVQLCNKIRSIIFSSLFYFYKWNIKSWWHDTLKRYFRIYLDSLYSRSSYSRESIIKSRVVHLHRRKTFGCEWIIVLLNHLIPIFRGALPFFFHIQTDFVLTCELLPVLPTFLSSWVWACWQSLKRTFQW